MNVLHDKINRKEVVEVKNIQSLSLVQSDTEASLNDLKFLLNGMTSESHEWTHAFIDKLQVNTDSSRNVTIPIFNFSEF